MKYFKDLSPAFALRGVVDNGGGGGGFVEWMDGCRVADTYGVAYEIYLHCRWGDKFRKYFIRAAAADSRSVNHTNSCVESLQGKVNEILQMVVNLYNLLIFY